MTLPLHSACSREVGIGFSFVAVFGIFGVIECGLFVVVNGWGVTDTLAPALTTLAVGMTLIGFEAKDMSRVG